jgi:hypothetical protein
MGIAFGSTHPVKGSAGPTRHPPLVASTVPYGARIPHSGTTVVPICRTVPLVHSEERVMGSLFSLLVASALAATTPGTSTRQPTTQPKEAVLQYVAPFQSLAGISYGMTAVDNQALILDQRTTARVASGLRTVSYSCPNESSMAGGSRLSFNFKAGQMYELVCREGQPAEIRAAGC